MMLYLSLQINMGSFYACIFGYEESKSELGDEILNEWKMKKLYVRWEFCWSLYLKYEMFG